MSRRYLLDTNVLSEPLRPRPDPLVMGQMERLDGRCATAAPVWHELNFWALRLPEGRRRAAIERYLQEVVWGHMEILPYTSDAAAWHAAERARLERRGQTANFVDGQIAAIVVVGGFVLATRNVADFKRFKGLSVENWFR